MATISFLPAPPCFINVRNGRSSFSTAAVFATPVSISCFSAMGFPRWAIPARAESANTVEVDVERKLGNRMNLQVSAYGYRLHDFLVAAPLPDGLIQYQ